MLQLFRVSNYALLENLEVEFGPGLNLLTGETGSGKSLIIDALGLLLGERTPAEVIRSGADTTTVEGIFVSELPENLKNNLKLSGINYDDNELIIRRELNAAGRSRAFLNGCLTTIQTLRALGSELVDLQGQGEHHALRTIEAQRRYLDLYGGNDAFLEELARAFDRMQHLQESLRKSQLNEQERLQRLDMLQFQLREIDDAHILPGEDRDLEAARTRLNNAEKLSQWANQAYDFIYDNPQGMLAQSRHALSSLNELALIDPDARASFDQLTNMRYTLEEIAFFLRAYLQKLEFEPGELERTESRLASLERLKRKYGGTLESVRLHGEYVKRELAELENAAVASSELHTQLTRTQADYLRLARKLSQSRRIAASNLERDVLSEMRQLAMEKIRFKVSIETTETPDEEDCGTAGRSGIDSVEFQVAVNPGEELRALSRTASGGELSRIHLALRNIYTRDWADRTMIFDEIDAGVGGRIAELIGLKLRQVARKNQVLCVTHLPQIAAQADHHFLIAKEIRDGRTFTRLHPLEEQARIEELARMMGGSRITETTMQHAREMLKNRQ
jgi:DNA repair protein RecN (Recombination protein N)